MKKNLSTIIAIISCAAVGICIFQNIHLKREISNLENNLSSQIMNVDGRISDIYANIDNHLAEQDNLLAVREPSWELEEMNVNAKTADIQCVIVPKEYRQGVTTAVLECNGIEYPMTFADGKFVASVTIPLFEESRIGEVRFMENDTVRVQPLDWYISSRYDLLPNVYVNNFATDSSAEKKDGKLVYNPMGEYEIQLEKKGGSPNVKSICLLPVMDGKEQKRIELPINKNDNVFNSPVDESFKIPYGSTLELYIEVTDDNGLCYRTKTENIEVDKTGNYTVHGGSDEETRIYTKDGELLY